MEVALTKPPNISTSGRWWHVRYSIERRVNRYGMLRCCFSQLPRPGHVLRLLYVSYLARYFVCYVHICRSIHTTIPNDVREAPSTSIGATVRARKCSPSTIPQCGSPPQILGVQQPIATAAAPANRILRRIFSASNLSQATPEICSIRALRELYHSTHARGMLGDLSGPQFSAIIALFGTLSVPDPPNQFKSPLAQHMDKGKPRVWWGLIFQMVRDKKRVTGVLKEGDLYWLMRAKASEAPLVDLNVYAGDSGGFLIYNARTSLISM